MLTYIEAAVANFTVKSFFLATHTANAALIAVEYLLFNNIIIVKCTYFTVVQREINFAF